VTDLTIQAAETIDSLREQRDAARRALARVEAIRSDCALKGYHPPLDPDSETEIEGRFAYADIERRLSRALASPEAHDETRPDPEEREP
jgi:hypothetical protein